MNVAHNQRHGRFNTARGRRHGVIAGFGIVDDALESKDPELTPASRKIGVGQFFHGFERHMSIIRLRTGEAYLRVKYWV